MRLERLRPGETLAALGGLVTLVLLFLDWARLEEDVVRQPGADVPAVLEDAARTVVSSIVGPTTESGWSALGWLLVALVVVTALLGIAQAALLVFPQPAAVPITVSVVAAFVGVLTTLALLVRLTLAQPDLDLGLEDDQVAILWPAWAALAAVAATTAGSWWALRDERTEAPYAAAPDVPVRPAPPAHPDAPAGD